MTAYRVTLQDRDERVIEVRPGETLLAAAERQGVPMMSACRQGACRTCAVRLVQGRVHQPTSTSLTQRLLDAHVVLACVATAASDAVLHLGPPGRTLLKPDFLLPWTD